ncbi:hypothetical protein BU26DRAFT_289475 [Trematosphaeria pertusa]|uniref:Uncharacterized protein n=1 Tax=Trematosphaeria pertusa TaxID=390896 RepID=A0A6A6IH87_9PLEO|nr:uncharacterized protein BU26DRAFT_289475 [Trematosphaeria pertusa]KAF2249791.1 hypothetical protein BU26DRAFT_289475 [Trematosphaeria pertusa]
MRTAYIRLASRVREERNFCPRPLVFDHSAPRSGRRSQDLRALSLLVAKEAAPSHLSSLIQSMLSSLFFSTLLSYLVRSFSLF